MPPAAGLSPEQLYALHTAGFLVLDEQLLPQPARSAALIAAQSLAAEAAAWQCAALPPPAVAATAALSSLCEHPRVTELLSELTGRPEGLTPAEAAAAHRWDGDGREFYQDGPARLLRGPGSKLSQLDTELYWRSAALRHSLGYVRDGRGGAAFLSLTFVWALEDGATVELLPASHAAAYPPPSPAAGLVDDLLTTLQLPAGSLLLVARSLVASCSADSSGALLCVDYAAADTFPTCGYELDPAAVQAASNGWIGELSPAQRRILGPRLMGQLQHDDAGGEGPGQPEAPAKFINEYINNESRNFLRVSGTTKETINLRLSIQIPVSCQGSGV